MQAEDRQIVTNLSLVLGFGIAVALGVVFAASLIA